MFVPNIFYHCTKGFAKINSTFLIFYKEKLIGIIDNLLDEITGDISVRGQLSVNYQGFSKLFF